MQMKHQFLIKIRQMLSSELKGVTETYEKLSSDIIMSKGASNAEIFACDSYFGGRLPEDYKLFLKEYNGGKLFQIEDFAGFEFLGCNELVKENGFQKDNFGDDWNENIILFCSCIGDGEYLGFKLTKPSTYQIVHCIMDELPSQWEIISDSLDDFIDKLIDERGKKFWLDN